MRHLRQLPWPDESDRLATREVNAEAGTVKLVRPSDTSLGALVLSTAPMVGCFGVAPVREQAISTRICSDRGGNMDYHGFCDGATIYLPVFVAGALFHLGDGHV